MKVKINLIVLLVILVCCNKVIFIKIIVCYLFLFIKVRIMNCLIKMVYLYLKECC